MLPCDHKVNTVLGWFVGGIFGRETPNLNDPYIYSTTILYDNDHAIIIVATD